MPDLSASARAVPYALQSLPSVDRALGLPALSPLIELHGRTAVVQALRRHLDEARATVQRGDPAQVSENELASALAARLTALSQPNLRRVFNLTGTVLHTNLGRAPLPDEAVAAMVAAATGACNLEYDLASGGRGDRDDLVTGLLKELTGCEAATIVNNNAAAVLLVLNALANRKEVIISRGEQIEIGGAFRMPDIMQRAGCKLREIGTTNRTHLRDYAEAIGPSTGIILKVHTSNYAVQGFTAAVSEEELGALAREKGIPLVVDLGAGALVDMSRWGLPREPLVQEVLAHGASVVTFSGDKLLGGPQAGLIVGQAVLIAKVKKNPLKRALRVDKVTMATLEAVLRLYRDPDRLDKRLTTLRLLARKAADIEAAAARMLPLIQDALKGAGLAAMVATEPCSSQIGSGALPVESLPSAGIAVRPAAGGKGEGRFLARVERSFRNLPVPVIGRIADGAFRLDCRCLEDEQGFAAQLAQLR